MCAHGAAATRACGAYGLNPRPIEDALCLAKSVASAPADLPAALKAYETARKYRTARVQLTARAMGAFFHLDGFAAETRNQMMAARNPTDYAMLDWLYGHKV